MSKLRQWIEKHGRKSGNEMIGAGTDEQGHLTTVNYPVCSIDFKKRIPKALREEFVNYGYHEGDTVPVVLVGDLITVLATH